MIWWHFVNTSLSVFWALGYLPRIPGQQKETGGFMVSDRSVLVERR
jgi:hypothetical protein